MKKAINIFVLFSMLLYTAAPFGINIAHAEEQIAGSTSEAASTDATVSVENQAQTGTEATSISEESFAEVPGPESRGQGSGERESLITSGAIDNTYIKKDQTSFLKDKFGIDTEGNSGAFSYSIPINVLPGRNNQEPNIYLTYNSNSKDVNSVVGFGWSINIPSITRISKNGVDKLYEDHIFTSALDGELVPVNLSDGLHGTYSAKVENGSFNIYEFNADDSWTVKDKLGNVFTFGSDADSRQDDPADTSRIYMWNLDESRDTNDNFVRYEYFKDSGQIYPSKVLYTGHGSTDGIFEVEFIRESRPDNQPHFKTGFAVDTKYRINEILIKESGDWKRKYTISYVLGSDGNRSFLETVQESTKDASGQVYTMPSEQVDYQNSEPTWDTRTSTTFPEYFVDGYNGKELGTRMADVNGDGLLDVLRSHDGSPTITNKVYINDGTTWIHDPSWMIPEIFADYYSSRDWGVRLTDVNSDGFVDILRGYKDSVGVVTSRVYINDGTSWNLDASWVLPEVFTDYYRADYGSRLADVNGDGLVDFVRSTCDFGGIYNVYINDGTNWVYDENWPFPEVIGCGNSPSKGVEFGDVNGDNLLDVVRSFEISSGPDVQKVYINNGSGWTHDPSWTIPEFFADSYSGFDFGTRLMDVNADGLDDLVRGYEGTNPNPSYNKVYINDGQSWNFEPAYLLPEYFTNDTAIDHSVRPSDVNGDGIIDIVRSIEPNGGSPIKDIHNGQAKHELVSQIITRNGAIIDLEYKSSTQYFDAQENQLNPNLGMSIDTLSKVTIDDGLGNTIETNFVYFDGDEFGTSLTERKFAGFGKVETISDDIKRIRYYHQGNSTDSSNGETTDSEYKIGHVYRSELVDESTSNTVYQTINKWQSSDLGNGNKFVYLDQEIRSILDGNSKSFAKTFIYDQSNGNLLTEYDLGEVTADLGTGNITNQLIGDETSIDWDYATNSSVNIVAAPKNRIVSDTTESKEQDIFYNNQPLGFVDKVNVTKEDYKDGGPGAQINRTFDNYGLVDTETDPEGNQSSIVYDSLNLYPSQSTNPLLQVTHTQYDHISGQVATTTDPNGLVTKNEFDTFGRIVKVSVSDPEAPTSLATVEEIIYDDVSFPRSQETKNYFNSTDYSTTREYTDGLGRLIQRKTSTDNPAEWSTVDISYDSQGRVERESLPYITSSVDYSAANLSQPARTYTYDALDRVLTETTPLGTTTYQYDGLTTIITDANGHRKDLTRDAYNNLVQVKEYEGANIFTTNYEYSLTNKLTKITDAQGNIKNFTYDALDNLEEQDMVHTSSAVTPATETYTHDKNGNVLTKTTFKGDNVSFTYDDLNRVEVENVGPWPRITYTYDQGSYGLGRLTTADYNNGNSKSYEYDVLGRVKKLTTSIENDVYVLDYEYDLAGNLSKIYYPDSDNSVVEYLYNSVGQVETVNLYRNGGAAEVIAENIDYNVNGQMTHLERGNGATTDWTYDPAQDYLLTNITTVLGATTLQNITYTYDNVGNILTITDTSDTDLARTATYTYDDLNRLKTADVEYATHSQDDYSRVYEYDAVGNMITHPDLGIMDYDNDQPHQLTGYSSDPSLTFIYDAAGNLKNDGTYVYNWDWRNRLTDNKKPNTYLTHYYKYDHNNQRFLKYTFDNGGGPTWPPEDPADPNGTIQAGPGEEVIDEETASSESSSEEVILESTEPELGDVELNEAQESPEVIEEPAAEETVENIVEASMTYEPADDVQDSNEDGQDAPPIFLPPGDGGASSFSSGPHRTTETHYVDRYYENNDIYQHELKHIFLDNTRIASISGSNDPVYPLSDHLGSSSIVTKSDGSIGEVVDYLPFGAENYYNAPNGPFVYNYTFTGKEYDGTENGMQYFGARYLNNDYGRFSSIEPVMLVLYSENKLKGLTGQKLEDILSDPQGLNSYTYSRNNPIILIDPDGNWWKELFTGKQSFSDFRVELGQAAQQLYNDSNIAKAAMDHPIAAGAVIGVGSGALAYGASAGLTALSTEYLGGAGTTCIAFCSQIDKANNLLRSGQGWSPGRVYDSAKNLVSHFDKHGSQVGAKNINQYYQKANEFIQGGYTNVFKEGADKVYYNVNNNLSAILDPNGSIRTFYRVENINKINSYLERISNIK